MSKKSSPLPHDSALEVVDQLRRTLAAVLQSHSDAVDCIYLFGSAARREAGPLSDLDLAILFSDSLPSQARAELAAELAGQAQRITGPTVDISILNDAPPVLKHRVIRDGRLLFVREEHRRVAFEVRAILEFLDFRPVLERHDRALLVRAREGRFGA